MNKEEFILKASDLLEWEKSLKEREEYIEKQEDKITKKAYDEAREGFALSVWMAEKDRDSYKKAFNREQKAHAETKLDLKRSKSGIRK